MSYLIYFSFFKENSFIKYIAEQNLTMDIFDIFKNYQHLRVKALECLEHLIMVSKIWTDLLSKTELTVSTFNIKILFCIYF